MDLGVTWWFVRLRSRGKHPRGGLCEFGERETFRSLVPKVRMCVRVETSEDAGR